MAKSLKVFQFLKKSYQTIGFHPSRSGQSFSFDLRNLFVLMSILQLCSSSLTYFLFGARSLFGYGASFYASITTLYAFIILSIKLRKISNILILIKKFEEYIERSKISMLLFYCPDIVAWRFQCSMIAKTISRPYFFKQDRIIPFQCSCTTHWMQKLKNSQNLLIWL